MTAIAVAHHVPYVAQAAATHWHDLSVKVERAVAAPGPAFLNVLTDCPVGWGHEPRLFAQVIDAAVDCLFWPLYEVVDGSYRLTYLPPARGCRSRSGSRSRDASRTSAAPRERGGRRPTSRPRSRRTGWRCSTAAATASRPLRLALMPARVLIAGAGVAALEAALALRSLAADRVEVELVGAEHHFWYRPLSVAEPFELGEATRYELPALAAAAGAHFTPGTLLGCGRLHVARARTSVGDIRYDFLLVAVGRYPSPPCRAHSRFAVLPSARSSSLCWTTSSRAGCAASRSPCRTAQSGRCRCTSWRC